MSEPPLSALVVRLSKRGDVPFGGLDAGETPENLWERLDTAAKSPSESIRVVPKRRYCQRCEHFSAPPRMTCTRKGTEILALVGTDRFRVRGCPVDRE